MGQNTPLKSHREAQESTKYVEIRVKSTSKPRYASDRLILYAPGLTEARVRAEIRQRLRLDGYSKIEESPK